MSITTRTTHEITVDQVRAIAGLEEEAFISHAVGAAREIEIQFTSSTSGGRHVYVRDIDGDGWYHIARNGNITWCERS